MTAWPPTWTSTQSSAPCATTSTTPDAPNPMPGRSRCTRAPRSATSSSAARPPRTPSGSRHEPHRSPFGDHRRRTGLDPRRRRTTWEIIRERASAVDRPGRVGWSYGAMVAVHWADRNPGCAGVVAVDSAVPYGITGEDARERIRRLFRRMRLLLPLARPLGLAARMTADQHAEV